MASSLERGKSDRGNIWSVARLFLQIIRFNVYISARVSKRRDAPAKMRSWIRPLTNQLFPPGCGHARCLFLRVLSTSFETNTTPWRGLTSSCRCHGFESAQFHVFSIRKISHIFPWILRVKKCSLTVSTIIRIIWWSEFCGKATVGLHDDSKACEVACTKE